MLDIGLISNGTTFGHDCSVDEITFLFPSLRKQGSVNNMDLFDF